MNTFRIEVYLSKFLAGFFFTSPKRHKGKVLRMPRRSGARKYAFASIVPFVCTLRLMFLLQLQKHEMRQNE